MAAPIRNISLDTEWRDEYQNRRYLEHDTDEQLKTRQRDILRNIFSFDRQGVFSVAGHWSQWDRLMAHIYTEAELRNLELEKILRVDGYFHAKRAAEIWAEYKNPLAPYLVKYTKRRFAEELLRLGQFRLSPADKHRD